MPKIKIQKTNCTKDKSTKDIKFLQKKSQKKNIKEKAAGKLLPAEMRF